MRLSNVILRVSDMESAVAFWRDRVGLHLVWAGDEFAFFAVGDSQLVLNQPEHYERQESDTEVVLEVDDMAAAFTEMREKGVPFEVDPRPVTSDGSRQLLATHFRDPDGHLASITGWVEEAS
ncbi:MAG TPA: VOC family protein [Acidimicrobiia bacterium]|nr:VOC family protein [Acidimicrobiia bacterium]